MYRIYKFDKTKVDYEYIDFKTRPRHCEDENRWTVIEVQAEGFFKLMDTKMSKGYLIPKFPTFLDEKNNDHKEKIDVVKFLDPNYSVKNKYSKKPIPLEMPIVSFENDELVFTNGRHRSRALEYLGVDKLFIEVRKDNLSKFNEILA